MRKVVLSNLVSLDGYMAGPGGDIEWFSSLPDKEFEAYAVKTLSSIDTILFGRVTYELMAGYWPTAKPEADDPRIIEAMNELPKIVFSRTLKSVDWNNSRLVNGDVAREVAKLKAQAGKDMVIYGSGSLVSALAPAGMIDEYRIFVAPVVLGSGKPLFRDVANRFSLKLLESRSFGAGLVLLRYRP
jgi:dihydrofolate reductase